MIYVTSVSMRSSDVIFLKFQTNAPSVESLRVTNHTECECIYKNRPTTVRPRSPYLWPMPTISTTTKAPACKCPVNFQAEIDDGNCGCVCSDSVAECRQRFEGNEGFTMSDQRFAVFNLCYTLSRMFLELMFFNHIQHLQLSFPRCILSSQCVQPNCKHGNYLMNNGRCPDKNEMINKGFQSSRIIRQSS